MRLRTKDSRQIYIRFGTERSQTLASRFVTIVDSLYQKEDAMSRSKKKAPKFQNRSIRKVYRLEMEQFEPRWYPGDAFLGPMLWLSGLGMAFGSRLGLALEGGRHEETPLARNLLGSSVSAGGATTYPITDPGSLSLLAFHSETGVTGTVEATAATAGINSSLPGESSHLATGQVGTEVPTSAESSWGWDWLGNLFADPLVDRWGQGKKFARLPEVESDNPTSRGGGDGGAPFAGGQIGELGSASFFASPLGNRGQAEALGLLDLQPGNVTKLETSQADDGSATGPGSDASPSLPRPVAQSVRRNYGQLPLSFETNRGQVDRRVPFLARGLGYNLFLTPTEAVLALHKPVDTLQRRAVLRLQMVGANPVATAAGLERLPGVSNYLRGRDPARWLTNIPTYGKVAFRNVYPGIDVVYYGTQQRRLEFDLVVAPGANPGLIQFAYSGASGLRLDARGNLVLTTPGGDVVQDAPTAYQVVNGRRRPVTARYVLQPLNVVALQVGNYDRTRPLYIDPVVNYSTYLGGSGDDFGNAIAVDAAGNAYVTGSTNSVDFPGQPIQSGLGQNVFVTKLDPSGTSPLYSTYFGGDGEDRAFSIAVDSSFNAYVTGATMSSNFPTTLNAYQPTYAGGTLYGDAFVSKLNATGTDLLYSTYLGGPLSNTADDIGCGIRVDSSQNIYVAGITSSTDFPTTPGVFQPNYGDGGKDAFVTKINPSLPREQQLVYSTYLGGSDVDTGNSIALDADNYAYVVGTTKSTDFPVNSSTCNTTGGASCYDAFVTKVNLTASARVYSKYLGGSGAEEGYGIAVFRNPLDPVGSQDHAYVAGISVKHGADPFPTIAGAYRETNTGAVGSGDAFVVRYSYDGSTREYSTLLGGNGDEKVDEAVGLAVDGYGVAYVAGSTTSTDFPLAGAVQPVYGGSMDGFVAQLDPYQTTPAQQLVFSTYVGGSGADGLGGIALGNQGIHVTGSTRSTDFPLTAPFQSAYAGNSDAVVLKFGAVPAQRRNELDATWLSAGPDTLAALNTGTLRVSHALDFLRSQNGALENFAGLGVTPALVYNSDAVNVRPIGEVLARFPALLGVPLSTGDKIRLDFCWNATDCQTPGSTTIFSPSGHAPGDTYLLAAQVGTPVTDLGTGVYPWAFRVRASFAGGQSVDWTFSDVAQVVVTDKTSDPTSPDNSPFGPGWSLAGLDRIVPINEDGTGNVPPGALMVYGSGDASRYFRLNPDGRTYSNPAEDFGTLVKDTVNMVTTYTYVSKDQVRRAFSGDGRLRTITDPNLLPVALTYLPGGQLRTVEMPDGGVTTFSYDGGTNLLNQIEEPGGRVIPVRHDANRDLVGITNADNNLRTFTYDSAHRLQGQEWLPVNAAYTYSAATGVLKKVDQGLQTTLDIVPNSVQGLAADPTPARNAADAVATVLYSQTRLTTYALDTQGRIAGLSRPGIPAETWLRDFAGQAGKYTDALDRSSQFSYRYGPGKGDLVRSTDADGAVERFTYEEMYHNLTRWEDELGRVTTYQYDPLGNLIETEDALGNKWKQTWNTYESSNPPGTLGTFTDSRNNTTSYTYDSQTRRLSTIEDANNQFTVFEQYDDAGNPMTVTDRLQHQTRFVFDNLRQLRLVQDALDGVFRTNYNALGQTTIVTDEAAQIATYAYDQRGWLTAMTEGVGYSLRRTTTYLYDLVGNMTGVVSPRQIDGNNLLTQFLYDNLNRVTGTIDAAGKETKTIYDAVGNVTSSEDQLQRIATFSYDKLNRRTEMTQAANSGNPLRRTTTYLYDKADNLTSVVSPRKINDVNLHTDFLIDKLNRVTVTIDALNQRTTTTFDAAGNVSSTKDPLNRLMTYSYDKLNRRSGMTTGAQLDPSDPGHRIVTYLYDVEGNLTRMIDSPHFVGESEIVTDYLFDKLNRVTVTIDALLQRATTMYDALDRVTSVEDKSGRRVTYSYDVLNRREMMTEAAHSTDPNVRRVTTFLYDAANNMTGTLRPPVGGVPDDRLTSYAYDALNRRTEVTDAAHLPPANPTRRTTTTLYDAFGNVTAIIDPVGNQTQFRFDYLNRVTVTVDPNNRQTVKVFDVADNVTSVTDRRGKERRFTYDGLNRRLTEAWMQTGTPINTLTFDYDAIGNVTSTTANGTANVYTYDDVGRPKEASNIGTPNAPVVTLTHEYSHRGARVETSAVINGNNDYDTEFLFDALDRMTTVSQTGLPGVTSVAYKQVKLAYSVIDRLTAVTRYAGTPGTPVLVGTTLYDTYDEFARLRQLRHRDPSSVTLDTLTWVFDVGDRITQAGSRDGTTTFVYDATDQLITATTNIAGQANETFAYDRNGNRTLAGTYTYDPHAPGNRIVSDGVYTYTHDDEGNRTLRRNLTTNERTEYEYDHRNRLTHVTDFSAASVKTMEATYTYDTANRRIAKWVDLDGAGVGPATTTQFVYDGQHIALSFEGNTSSAALKHRYLHGPAIDQILADERLDQTGNLRVVWPLTDHLGNVRDLVDSAGAFVADSHVKYDSFGRIVGSPPSDLFFAYTGREWDAESRLYYYRARYYDQGVGRFLNEDPIGLGPDVNPYRYVGNGPINHADPSGLETYRVTKTDGGVVNFKVPDGYTPQQTREFIYRLSGGKDKVFLIHGLDDRRDGNPLSVNPALVPFGLQKEAPQKAQPSQSKLPAYAPGLDPARSATEHLTRTSLREASLREIYKQGDLAIRAEAQAMVRAGQSEEAAARWVVEARNQLRRAIREQGEPIVAAIAEGTRGPRDMPTYDSLRARDKTNAQIIESAGRTNPKVDRWVGRIRIAGRILIAVDIGLGAYKVATAPEVDRPKVLIKETARVGGALAGGWAGAKTGGAVGAFAGSFFPGPGTLIGGGVGSILGGIGGAIFGGWAAGEAADWVIEKYYPPAETRFEKNP